MNYNTNILKVPPAPVKDTHLCPCCYHKMPVWLLGRTQTVQWHPHTAYRKSKELRGREPKTLQLNSGELGWTSLFSLVIWTSWLSSILGASLQNPVRRACWEWRASCLVSVRAKSSCARRTVWKAEDSLTFQKSVEGPSNWKLPKSHRSH